MRNGRKINNIPWVYREIWAKLVFKPRSNYENCTVNAVFFFF